MKWVVDVGNSAIRWMPTDKSFSAQKAYWLQGDPAGTLDKIWANIAEKPTHVLCSCVAGQGAREVIQDWCKQQWQLCPVFIHSPAKACGVENAYKIPGHLGTDRWAALVAARHTYKMPVCIVDCGTAITIDVLDEAGYHQGGLIFPGLNLMQTALLDRTGIKLEETGAGNTLLFARSTADALNGGGLYAVVAAVDRMVADVNSEMKAGLVNIITGGDADTLLPLLSGSYDFCPDLVLDGLVKISESCLETCT